MEKQRFILERKNKSARSDKYPTIRVSQAAYEILADMAYTSGQSIAEIANRSVKYAADNLTYVDEM